jgi:hypothetical protein
MSKSRTLTPVTCQPVVFSLSANAFVNAVPSMPSAPVR